MRIFTEAERKAGQVARQAKRRAMIAATQHYKKEWLGERQEVCDKDSPHDARKCRDVSPAIICRSQK